MEHETDIAVMDKPIPKRGRPRGKCLPFADTDKKPHLRAGSRIAIEAMLEMGLTERQIAIEVECSKSTVHTVKTQLNKSDRLNVAKLDRIKRTIESRIYQKADKSLTHITDDKLKLANVRDVAVTFGILHQHARLAGSQSTENVAVILSNNLNTIEGTHG